MAKKKGKREEGFTFPEFDKEEFRQKELRDSSNSNLASNAPHWYNKSPKSDTHDATGSGDARASW